MKPNLSRRFTLLAAAACLTAAAGTVHAQGYPQRPVKIVVPYPAGSTPDALARIVGESLSKRISQPVVVENRPGAGGMIGAKLVSDAEPDGTTLLMFTPAWSAAKVFMKKPPVSVPDGLEPVTIVAEGSAALTVSAGVPARSFQELVAHAKASPGKLNFATTGLGDNYLYFQLLQREKGIKLEAIQYKGSAEYVSALITNDVQMALTPQYSMVPYVREGKLRILAVTGDKRSKIFPDAPTFAELGLPKLRNNWFGLFAPRSTPASVVARLNADLAAVIRSPETGSRIQEIYFEPVGSDAAQLRKRIDTEIAEWTELARQAGIEAK